jgi:hypothetical protein
MVFPTVESSPRRKCRICSEVAVPAFSATARGFRSDSRRYGWRPLDAAEWVVESLNGRCGLIK